MSTRGGYGFCIVGCGMVADFHAQAIAAMRGGHLACIFQGIDFHAGQQL